MLIPAELFSDCLAVHKIVYLYLHILLIFVPLCTLLYAPLCHPFDRMQLCMWAGGHLFLGRNEFIPRNTIWTGEGGWWGFIKMGVTHSWDTVHRLLFRCQVKIGTPKNRHPGCLISRKNRHPDAYIYVNIGTGRKYRHRMPIFTVNMGIPLWK